jgi:hypothetical protein
MFYPVQLFFMSEKGLSGVVFHRKGKGSKGETQALPGAKVGAKATETWGPKLLKILKKWGPKLLIP